ncbi:DUF2252 domain-containing protein [Nocardia huaxiensis]|uniref:DUF2252 domain-containing protein n=1 Tax=Nocardia huaxiensis TaxID=2755382 RepID=A0A7D6ZG91_9NOCA|nr:DUF2252 domain-containing protein [Nocardia huaxiensis]QLY33018.1 DUF2252 domain-containing protein [Nocardia huaxiensis]UFS93220.1 DUF2252 domain-containing protein [Nocardia huaxiensis]
MATPEAQAAANDPTAIETGRAARKRIARSALGAWNPPEDRADPLAILEQQAATRVADLVRIRYARMAAGQFPFYRGAPAIMAADLASGPHTGLTVQLCGDAHLSNFGLFASPERALVFDLNDFDETLPGPFEWDVKRLAASLAVAARANGCDDTAAGAAATAAAGAYREAMNRFSLLGETDVWYQMTDAQTVADLLSPKDRKLIDKVTSKAKSRTSLQALDKLTEPGPDGTPIIRHDPPLLMPIPKTLLAEIDSVLSDYRKSLPEERRVLLDRYELRDVAMKVVGVGSVGTRCFVALLTGRSTGDPLFLQVKQAEDSVLAQHLSASIFRHQGHRVVHGQRLTQAAGDIFLGWATGPDGNFYYWRQLRDMKGSVTIEDMSAEQLRQYAILCGHTLARGHARSGDRVAISAYLGGSDGFDRAMGEFALAYADQTARDYETLLAGIDSGRITAATEE